MMLSENMAFEALSLVVIGVFCWTLYYFRAEAWGCLRSMVDFSSVEKGAPVENKLMYGRFQGVAMMLGALSLGLAAVKADSIGGALAVVGSGSGSGGSVGSVVGSGGLFDGMGPEMVAVAAMGVAGAIVVLALVQAGVMMAAGGLTLSGRFVGAVIRIKKNCISALSLLIVPVVAVWSGVNPMRDEIAGWIFAGVVAVVASMFVAHTLVGFVKQKVSLLVWFLYLCAVEIVPVWAIVPAVMNCL
jgi:hypothetical protein